MGQVRKVIAISLVGILLGCSSNDQKSENAPIDTSTDSTVEPDVNSPTIKWESCGNRLDCGTIKVPYDYEKPDLGSFTLQLKRHNARKQSQKIGSLMVNPGGPGSEGLFLAEAAEQIFSQQLVNRFDIVAWDPRGAGTSTPYVDCIDVYDNIPSVDVTPDNAAERQALIDDAQEFVDDCQQNSGEILPYISTKASATDIDTIRRALGEEKISYFGFSYGSELGATWATMFPKTVRAAVLDGASEVNATRLNDSLTQIKGFEATFQTFLNKCAKDSDCLFYNDGNPAGAYDTLVKNVDNNPVRVRAGRAAVDQSILETAVAEAMYDDNMWDELEQALADLQIGNGSGILELNDRYYGRNSDGTYPNLLEAFVAITCLDDPGATSIDEVDANAHLYAEVAPRLGPGSAYGYTCALWPVRGSGRIVVTGKGAGPIVVIGTTGDPSTPLEASRSTARQLEDGILIVVQANQHTGYGENNCVVNAVDTYLIDLDPPEDEILCK